MIKRPSLASALCLWENGWYQAPMSRGWASLLSTGGTRGGVGIDKWGWVDLTPCLGMAEATTGSCTVSTRGEGECPAQ